MQLRIRRSIRVQFEVGKQFANRDTVNLNVDRESYFFNFGYQLFF